MLPKYLAVAIQAGIENHTGRSKFLNVDTLSSDGPAAKAVGGKLTHYQGLTLPAGFGQSNPSVAETFAIRYYSLLAIGYFL